jgi:peptidoglycan/xylan/chitin deacetylase (PgdA/CDA1 family)
MKSSIDAPILMYHDVVDGERCPESPTYAMTLARFRKQLDMLEQGGFRTLTFTEFFKALRGEMELPGRFVLLTFDDGYRSFSDTVVPELVRRNMKATFFIAANAIGKENYWDAHLGGPLTPLMDEDQIRSVMAAGMELGVHGAEHRDLLTCSHDELMQETLGARSAIVSRFGVHATAFCYPFGHYEERHFPILARAGFEGAVAIFTDYATVTENLYAMRRVHVHEGDVPIRFRLKLTPLYYRFIALRDGRRASACYRAVRCMDPLIDYAAYAAA